MTLRGPLKAELFKYRKRKQISLDGIAGMPPSSPESDKPVMGYIPPGSAPESFLQYDPTSARYEDAHPTYDPPQSWFNDLHIAPPPDIRMDPFPEHLPPDIVVSPTGWGTAFIEWYDRHNGRVVIELTADQVQILGTLRPWLNPLSMHDEPTGAIFVMSPERRMPPMGTSSVVHARDLCRS